MAAKKNAPAQAVAGDEVKIRIMLPLRQSADDGIDADQTETVTIANVNGPSTNYQITRGVSVEVSEEVFRQLKNRFPNL